MEQFIGSQQLSFPKQIQMAHKNMEWPSVWIFDVIEYLANSKVKNLL